MGRKSYKQLLSEEREEKDKLFTQCQELERRVKDLSRKYDELVDLNESLSEQPDETTEILSRMRDRLRIMDKIVRVFLDQLIANK